MNLFLVTIKGDGDPTHNPRDKRRGICPTSSVCTDWTGQHHTIAVWEDSSTGAESAVREWFEANGPWAYALHITRTELATVL